MAVYSIKAVQKIPVSLTEVWDFFSDHANLQRISPAHMKLRVISKHHGSTVYPGQVIEYKIKPLLGISLYWMTEITHVEYQKLFVDEQRYGPFSLWHHQHHFAAIPGGVQMTDIIHYKNPLWMLGDLANTLFVKKQLEDIFRFRESKVEELFGRWNGA